MPSPTTMDDWLARVRAMLRRHVLLNAAWLDGVRDGPAGRAFVAFVMDKAQDDARSAEAELAELDAALGRGAADPLDRGAVAARFGDLSGLLGLSATDCDALWVLLAPEIDLRFLAAYRMLWAEPERRYCAETFVQDLLSPSGPRAQAAAFGHRGTRLARLGLVHLTDESLRGATCRPDPRLVDYLVNGRAVHSPDEAVGLVVRGIERWSLWEGFDLGRPLRYALRQSPALGSHPQAAPLLCIEARRYASMGIAVAQLELRDGTSAVLPRAGVDFIVRLERRVEDDGPTVGGLPHQRRGVPDLRQGDGPARRGAAASDAEGAGVARAVGARASGRGGERGEGLKRGTGTRQDRRGTSGAGTVGEKLGFRGAARGADGAERASARASGRGVAVGWGLG